MPETIKHQAAKEVVVIVEADEKDKVSVLPDEVRVENVQQTVVWVAIGGEIENIEFHPGETPAPPAIARRGRRIEARFPEQNKHTGSHKYKFTFHKDGGKSIPVDPIAVIEY